MAIKLLLLLFISSCSFSFNKDKEKKIIIEELEPIKDTKVECDTDNLTELQIAKCKMEARLLELKY
jgi:hypothetical protein|tara:strand:+ start:3618 stop:3815 length:198 start_codon:yes stop_codon:yes gene_type:complete